MVIYLDLESKKIKFIQQQNSKKYFVVDFLFEKQNDVSFEREFMSVLDEHHEIIEILKHEKNFLVLPNDAVGITNMKVPFAKKDAKQYAETKLNLMFPNQNEIVRRDEVYFSDKNLTQFVFIFAKKDYINNITKLFQKAGIKISGISFMSAMELSHLQKTKQVAKENVCVLKISGNKVQAFAASKGMLIAHQKIDFDGNIYAKKFAEFIKSSYKKLGSKNINFEENIEQKRVNLQKNTSNLLKIQFIIKEFSKYFRNAEIPISFDKTFILQEDDQEVATEGVNNLLGLHVDEKDILLAPFKNIFMEEKRRFFWK